jgi:hypothetical protein
MNGQAKNCGGGRALQPVAITPRHPAFEHIDPQTAFLYAPHTVTVLLIGRFYISAAWEANFMLNLLDDPMM